MTFETITQLFTHYGYWIIFPIAVIEGPVVSIVSGFFISLKLFNLYLVLLVLIIADLVGDTLYYALGRYGGRWFLSHFGEYFGATPTRISFLEENFKKNDWKLLLFGKTQAISALVLFVAGLLEVNYFRFISFSLIGAIPKTILFVIVGFYFGKTYSTSSKYFDYFSFVWLILSVVLVVGYIYIGKYIKRKAFNNTK